MRSPLSPRQQTLLDAIPSDGEWHRVPLFTKAQTLLSLVDRKLLKLKPRPDLPSHAILEFTYAFGYVVSRPKI